MKIPHKLCLFIWFTCVIIKGLLTTAQSSTAGCPFKQFSTSQGLMLILQKEVASIQADLHRECKVMMKCSVLVVFLKSPGSNITSMLVHNNTHFGNESVEALLVQMNWKNKPVARVSNAFFDLTNFYSFYHS